MSVMCERKVAEICKKHRMPYRIRDLKFGFQRAEIRCDNDHELDLLVRDLKRIKSASVETDHRYGGCAFSGRICVMDADCKRELDLKLNEEQKQVTDWWLRFHEASAEIKQRMACGDIA